MNLLQESLIVIPAEAGIQFFNLFWTPAPAPDYDPGFAGVTEYAGLARAS